MLGDSNGENEVVKAARGFVVPVYDSCLYEMFNHSCLIPVNNFTVLSFVP